MTLDCPPQADLSGGERNRVHLAKQLRQRCNVLVLDEPTNDLDVETLRSLEEALTTFDGCLVVISHDRWFLDRLSTDIIAFDGQGQAEYFRGSYSEFEAKRRQLTDGDSGSKAQKKVVGFKI